MKWKMNSNTDFTAIEEGYTIKVEKGSLGWVWGIFYDGKQLDSAYQHHSAPTSELDAKCKAERHFKNLMESTLNP